MHWNRSRASLLAGVFVLPLVVSSLGGCYSAKGGLMPTSTGAWTYVASETLSKTVTMVDLRTKQPFFTQTIPAGQQLTIQFLEGGGDDPQLRPDRLLYELQAVGTQTGRLRNQMTVPPAPARRIDISIDQTPTYREPDAEARWRTDNPESRPDYWSPKGGERPPAQRPMYDG